jgi:hypothetical protein
MHIGLLIVEAIDALEGSYIPSSTSLALIIKKASAEQTGSRGKLHFFPPGFPGTYEQTGWQRNTRI